MTMVKYRTIQKVLVPGGKRVLHTFPCLLKYENIFIRFKLNISVVATPELVGQLSSVNSN